MADSGSSPTYNNGLYTPWTTPSNEVQPTLSSAAAPVAEPSSNEPLTEPRTTTQAYVEPTAPTTTTTEAYVAPTTPTTEAYVQPTTTTVATVPAAETTTTSAGVSTTTSRSTYIPVMSTPPASPNASSLLTTSPASTSSTRSHVIISGPSATSTGAIGSSDSANSTSSATASNGFKVTYLIPLFIFLPCIILGVAIWMARRKRRRQQRLQTGGGWADDRFDAEEGGRLVVGGKRLESDGFDDSDTYSEKTSTRSVQRRPSKWSFVRGSLGRGRRRGGDSDSEISDAPSLPFRAVSYSSLQGPEDRPFNPPTTTESRAVDFGRYFNTLPRVDERDIEAGQSHGDNGRWNAPGGLGGMMKETAIDTSKWMLGGWGWASGKKANGTNRSAHSAGDSMGSRRSNNRIVSPSIYSPNPQVGGGAYDGLEGVDEVEESTAAELDAYLGESRVGDSTLAHRYLDNPPVEPYRDDYRLPASPRGPKPMPRPEIAVDLPTAPTKTFLSPTKKSGVLPASDHATPPPNAGLLFKYESPASTPTRASIATPSSPRPPLPTPPAANNSRIGSPMPPPRSNLSNSDSTYSIAGVIYESRSQPQPQRAAPLPPRNPTRPLPSTSAATTNPPLRKKASRDVFVQSLGEIPPPAAISTNSVGVRKKQHRAIGSTAGSNDFGAATTMTTTTASPIKVDFGDAPTLKPLKHPSKVKNAIYDLEQKAVAAQQQGSPVLGAGAGADDLMTHHSPTKAVAPSSNSNVGKLLLARRAETTRNVVDDDDASSVYSIDESVIAERPITGKSYTRPVKDQRPLSADPKRLSAMLRRSSLPQIKVDED